MELRVDAADRGDVSVLAPVGDIDLHTAPVVDRRIEELEAVGRRTVVVDLTGVEFLDSSGLGMFVAAQHRLSAAGGGLRIACPPPHAQKVFRITRLAEVIPVYDSVDESIDGA
jgi:anti-sigma B factor antagonist